MKSKSMCVYVCTNVEYIRPLKGELCVENENLEGQSRGCTSRESISETGEFRRLVCTLPSSNYQEYYIFLENQLSNFEQKSYVIF